MSALIELKKSDEGSADIVSLVLLCPFFGDVLERGLHALELLDLLELLGGSFIEIWIVDNLFAVGAAERPAGGSTSTASHGILKRRWQSEIG